MNVTEVYRKKINTFFKEDASLGVWGGKYLLSEMRSAMNGLDIFLDAAKRIEKELRME